MSTASYSKRCLGKQRTWVTWIVLPTIIFYIFPSEVALIAEESLGTVPTGTEGQALCSTKRDI